MSSIVLVVRLLLAAVFAAAGIGKLLDIPGSRRALIGFGTPPRLVRQVAVALPIAELAIAAALVPAASARWAAIGALMMLGAFSAAIARAIARGQQPDCHCFGQLHSAPAGRATLLRNGTLAAFAAFVVVAGPGKGVGEPGTSIALAACGGAIVLALLSATLWRMKRDLERDLEGLRAGHGTGGAEGLPVGALSPKIDADLLDGGRRALSDLWGRGRPVLLLFLDPDCPSCGLVLEHVATWQRRLRERLEIAIVSGVDQAQSRAFVQEHGIASASVLLQRRHELFDAFRITSTPSAVVLSADGRISATTASTALQIEATLRLALRQPVSRAMAPESGAAPERVPVSS